MCIYFFYFFFFSQVEATKFTEVGFHGRDVDQIIKDLVEVSTFAIQDHRRTPLTLVGL